MKTILKYLWAPVAIAAGVFVLTSFSNCMKISTAPIDPIRKAVTVSHQVFANADDPGQDIPNNPPGDDTPGTDDPGGDPDEPGTDLPPGCTPKVIPISYDCSNVRTNDGKKAMLSTAVSLTLQVGNCTDSDPSVLAALINEKKIVSKKCNVELQKASCSKYLERAGIKLIATNAAGVSNDIISSKSGRKDIYVIYAINDKDTPGANAKCDIASSPLFVLLKESEKEPKPVAFSAPLDGIVFDIFGQRANHKPFLISWYHNENLYFLVKPNEQGEVRGADELFGDNTKGPDGKYAKNGYLALAKYDSDSDGAITRNDVVYRDLRLWNDANYDGKSQAAELYTLNEKQIEVIDLDYDENYKEVDHYGNRIMYKSVMRTDDEQLHVMFDIWFRALPASLKSLAVEPKLIGSPVFQVPESR